MPLNIKIIAPDKTIWDTTAEEIILPSSTGQLGILVNHAPLLTALDIGVMRIRIKKQWMPVVLLGGFAEIENNEIIILVNGAEEIADIDLEKSQLLLKNATSMLQKALTNKDKIEATQNIRKARARLQAAMMEKG
uniref:ATP synthase CF1 epsilon subunit n=1 Tax=Apophlaea sinclairii TaxID=212746 RepID=A0A1C9CBE8_9FLOR|nr:ATP synthase CF1 epsilon subunit [Apophlaea sinclairii]AOM65720.1 ATP synthase CF1 epsilon subunit [Apophlaea sinclairii]